MLFYSVLGFIRPAIAVLLIPIYLNVFTEKEWAIYSLMLVVGGFMVILATLRINAAMLTKYYDYFLEGDKLKRYLQNIFTSSIVIGLVVLLVSLFTGEYFFDLIFESEEIVFFPFGITILLYAVFAEINQAYIIYLRNEKNLQRYALVVLSQVLLVILLQFILIVIFRTGVEGALIGMVAANAMTFIMILFMEKRLVSFDIDWEMVRSSLRFSILLIPYLIIYWFMTKGERIVIEQFMDLELVGKYILLVTITGVTILLIEAVINGIRPFLFELFKEKKDKENLRVIQLLTSLIVNAPLLALPVIILLGNNLRIITANEEYFIITPYVALSCVVAYSLVYAKLFYQQLVFAKRSFTATLLALFSSIIFVLALIYLIPLFEIWGVIIAVLIVNLTMGFLFFIYGQKAHPVSYSFRQIIINPLFICSVIILSEAYLPEIIGNRSLYSILLAILLFLLIYILNRKNIQDYRRIFLSQSTL